MKKLSKLLILPLFVLLLQACNNNNQNATEVTTTTSVETTSLATTTQAQVSTPSDTTTSEVTSENEGETTNNPNVGINDVPFTVYVNGEEVASYVAKDAVGMSVLDAMQSIEGLDFTFDEEEGVITNIAGNEADYAAPLTWVYTLNKQLAEYGVVSQTLSEGDEIVWYLVSSLDEVPNEIIPAESE